MSVSLSWEPKPEQELNYLSDGSKLEKALTETFGTMPITLESEHVGMLEVMASCGFDSVRDLIEAIYKYGRIEVDSHY